MSRSSSLPGNLTESQTDEQVTQQFVTVFAEGG
jgi:hypothetical protein